MALMLARPLRADDPLLIDRDEALLRGITCRYTQPEIGYIQAKPLRIELTAPARPARELAAREQAVAGQEAA